MHEVAQGRQNRKSKQGGRRASGENGCRLAGALELEEGKAAECTLLCVCARVLLWNRRGLGVDFKLRSKLRTVLNVVGSREEGLGIDEGRWQSTEAGG